MILKIMGFIGALLVLFLGLWMFKDGDKQEMLCGMALITLGILYFKFAK